MIREFYRGRTLLLTGATGFLGQGLVAKILRDLPEVKKIYALIRPRRYPDGRSLSAAERLEEEVLKAAVFDRFRREDPQGYAAACQKIAAVSGDMTAPALGVDEETWANLRAEVDLIVSLAATVTFDEPLDQSLRLNALGPRQLLAFAGQCERDPIFVQVSTAYVNGRLSGVIPERLLPPDRTIRQLIDGRHLATPFDPEAEIADCQAFCQRIYEQAASPAQREFFWRELQAQNHRHRLSEKRLAKLVDDRCRRWRERRLIEEGMRRAKAYGWNDVYTFTKALGEQLLVKHRGQVRLVIVRPSVVESSLEDPEPGWIFGLKVTDPLIVAYGRGLVPDFPVRDDIAMDLVPVDIVVNAILAAATQAKRDRVEVFHAATSGENPLMSLQMYAYIKNYFRENPMRGRDGQVPVLPEWTFSSVRWFRWRFLWGYLYPLQFKLWLLDRLPDRWAPQKRRLATLEKRLRRVLYFTELFSPYTTLNCRFEAKRLLALFASLPPEEQRLFNLDVRRLDWQHYYQRIHLPGLRRHVLKELPGEEGLLREAPEEVGDEEERWQAEESIQTIPDLARWAGTRYADKIALQQERHGIWRRYTYAELLERVEAVACTWQGQGLQVGERVLLWGESGPEWVIAYLAASWLGLAVVPLDPQLPPEEVWDLAEFIEARALIFLGTRFPSLSSTTAEARQAKYPLLLSVDLDKDDSPSGQSGAKARSAFGRWQPSPIEPEQVASIFFTSGLSRQPRGIMLTHRNLIADLLALAEVLQIRETDHLLSVLPLHQALAFVGELLLPLLGGATITYLDHPNSREIFRSMRATGTTVLFAVPRLLKIMGDRVQRLLDQAGGREIPEWVALRRLRWVVSSSAPLPLSVFDLYQSLGVALCEGYELTEAGPIVAINPPERVRRGSVGLVLPGVEVAIAGRDSQGRGEILVRGPNVMAGYYACPELTAQVLVDGWLHTGDLGYLDEEGYLYLTGRRKNLIVTGTGRNVYPEEIEMRYRELPHVAELSVVGVISPRTGNEEIHGVAVLAQGKGDKREEEMRQEITTCADSISRRLPSFQRIQRLHLWRRPLPRLDDGEVDRVALLAELALTPQEGGEMAELEIGLPDWERSIYRLISQITGLSLAEVVAHREAPLDTLLDSLMTVEFAALLESRFGVEVAGIDRSRTLRQLLEGLGPPSAGKSGDGEEAGAATYWAEVLASAKDRAKAESRVGRRWGQRALWRVSSPFFRRYFSLRVRGLEHLPQDRPYLLAANHASHLDSVAILIAVHPWVEECTLVAAQDYFLRSRLQRWLLRHLINAEPLDRFGNFQENLIRISARLGVRRPLLIFPEGRRSLTGQLQTFKLGIGLLAFELEVPIVPVHVCGTYEALPKGRNRPRRRPVSLLFGVPLEVSPYRQQRGLRNAYDLYREIAEHLRREIEGLAVQNR